MDEEVDAIETNNNWELVDSPKGKNTIGFKRIYNTKVNVEGEIEKHKSRLVADGFSQNPGIDYNETCAPLARLDTLRIILAIVEQNKRKIYQMDVKSKFLKWFSRRRGLCETTSWI